MKKRFLIHNNSEVLKPAFDHICFVLGSAVYAFAFSYFIDPNKISPGGLTGIAAIINYLFALPTGIVLFCLNIPILVLGFVKIGGKFIFKTLLVTVYVSVLIDIFGTLLPAFKGERLLAAIFGGVLSGVGLSIVMLRGATTGGVDVIAKVMKRKFPFTSMGRLLLLLDGLVVALATLCYRDVETALFTVISLFVGSKVIDAVLYGGEQSRLVFIVTSKGDSMAEFLYEGVGRGVTFVPALGGYSKKNTTMLLCAMRKQEVGKAIHIIRECDPSAFTVVTLAGGVFGYGFERKEI